MINGSIANILVVIHKPSMLKANEENAFKLLLRLLIQPSRNFTICRFNEYPVSMGLDIEVLDINLREEHTAGLRHQISYWYVFWNTLSYA